MKLSKEDLSKLTHMSMVRLTLFCAYQIEATWKHIPEAVKAIETTKRWLNGEASAEECRFCCDFTTYNGSVTTFYIASAVTHYTTYYTLNAIASTIQNAVNRSNKNKIIADQRAYYEELLDINKVFEDEILV